MIVIVNKPSSVGSLTLRVPELFDELSCQLAHFLTYFDYSAGNLHFPCFVSQITFIHYPETFAGKPEELLSPSILCQSFADRIDLASLVMSFRISHEQNPIERLQPGNDIDERTVWSLPDDMKLRFQPDPSPFPNRPTETLFATVGNHMLWNNRKTFVEWLIGQGLHRDIKRLTARNHAAAE